MIVVFLVCLFFGFSFNTTFALPPNTAIPYSPYDTQSSVSVTPQFQMLGADPEGNNLSYKVTIYSSSGCSANVVQTNDQAVNSTGWTGQNTTCTNPPTSCYTNGSSAYYTVQNALSGNTQYWWKVSVKDPDQSNTFFDSTSCYSFTTGDAPPPSNPYISSASYEIHASRPMSIVGSASSTNYRNRSAGGQLATGIISNTKTVYSGILYWLYGVFSPLYDTIHFRWRNDDGNESAATFAVSEDGDYLNIPSETKKRLRFLISNEGWTRGNAPQFTLEVAQTATCSSGTYSAVPTVSTGHWVVTSTTYISDAAATTNVSGGLTDENTTFVAGQVKTTGNTTGAITLSSSNFTEIEFSIAATANATPGASYCFRVTNNGSTTNMNYTRYARATVQAGLPATGELTSIVFDTQVPDGATFNSIMWKGTEGSGRVKFQLATANSEAGPWNYVGSDGTTCGSSFWYDTGLSGSGGGPGKPTEILCAKDYHTNQRYFRYKIQICSASDCSSAGSTSPSVDDIVVNWSP